MAAWSSALSVGSSSSVGAPSSNKSLTHSSCPLYAAMLSGLHPVSVHLHGSAPNSSSSATLSCCPWFAAVRSGVSLHLFSAWTSASPRNSWATHAEWPGLPPAHALWSGVLRSSLTRQFTGASASSSSWHMSSYPLWAAKVKADQPASEQRLGSAPLLSRARTASTWPLFAAMRSGVSDHLLQALTSAPLSRRRWRTSTLPGGNGPGVPLLEFVGLELDELTSPEFVLALHAVWSGLYRSSLNWQLTLAPWLRHVRTPGALPSSTAHLR